MMEVDTVNATDRAAISRGMPVAKAMEEHTIIATRMNGQPIPQLHGYPLRLIVPGWPGSLSQKWLTRITLLAELRAVLSVWAPSAGTARRTTCPPRCPRCGTTPACASAPPRSSPTAPGRTGSRR